MAEQKGQRFVLLLLISFAAVAVAATVITPGLVDEPSPQPRPAAERSETEQEGLIEMLEIYEHLAEQNPENPDYRVILGNLYSQLGDWSRAAENLVQAAELEPENAHLQIDLGITLWHAGREEEGLVHFDEALRLDPSLIFARYYKGMLLGGMAGREEEAIAELEQVLADAEDPELIGQAGAVLRTLLGRR